MDDPVDLAAVIVVKSVYSFSLAFLYCSHQDSSSLQWDRRLHVLILVCFVGESVKGFMIVNCML